MSNVFTLDAIREETIRRYAPTVIDLGEDVGRVELRNILKLREKDRDAVLAVIEEIKEIEDTDDDDEESLAELSELVCEAIEKIFRLIAKGSVKKLLAGLEHDDPQIKANLYTTVLNKWIGESQVGEAESSPS
jgi:hypothetical protein